MTVEDVQVTTAEPLLGLLSSGAPVALTAPLVLEDQALVGYHSSTSHCGTCAVIPSVELLTAGRMLYEPRTAFIKVHGLKRIWEALDVPDGEPRYVNLDLVHDTKLMAYLLDPDAGDQGLTLSVLAAQYLQEEYPHRALDIRDKDYPGAFYAALAYDAAVIWRLSEVLPTIMSTALLKLYRQLELPLILILDQMRREGIGVDGVTCIRERERIQAEMSALAGLITGNRDVDLSSDKDVFQLLIDRGVRFASTFVRKVSDSLLEEVAHFYPIAQQLLRWRELDQDRRFLKWAAGKTRVHPVWRQMRAKTSRIYASQPAVQNVSRELRYLFVPRPGCVFVKADYAQAQLRILAHLSEDENLMALFNTGRDPHGETAQWLGIDRDSAKQVNFGMCFGISAATLAIRISELRKSQGREPIDEVTAQGYIDSFYKRFPGVGQFFANAWQALLKQRKGERITTAPSGRIRRFDTRATDAVERKFRITWPQQMEADMIKTAMVRLDRIFHRRNMKARIVMVIHDALWAECPEEEVDQVRHLVNKMMTTAASLRVPLKVDFS
jgi:DNA polymerase I